MEEWVEDFCAYGRYGGEYTNWLIYVGVRDRVIYNDSVPHTTLQLDLFQEKQDGMDN